jgi:hypothetical protein
MKLLYSLLFILIYSNIFAQSGTWTELKPKNSPPGRVDFGMSSIGDGKAIIFGGQGSTPGYLGDTWIYDYDSNNWTEIVCDVSPSPRARINLAYLNDKKVLLYGGKNYNGYYLSDTWIFDIDSLKWFEIKPKSLVWFEGEFGRDDYALAHLSKNKGLMYSGHSALSLPDDVWIFDLDSLSWFSRVPTSTNPGNLQHTQMTYLSEGKTLLFGGFSLEKHNINETWIFDESIKTEYYWKKLYPVEKPVPSSEHALSELNENYIILTGVFSKNFIYSMQTWVYDKNKNNWVILDTSNNKIARTRPKMMKIKQNKTILFGGTINGVPNNDTWLFSFDPTDVPESSIQDGIIISPNPASDYIEISLNPPSIKRGPGGVLFEIFNVFGEMESTSVNFVDTSASGGHLRIDVSNFAPGVYFIRIGDRFEKFVKL